MFERRCKYCMFYYYTNLECRYGPPTPHFIGVGGKIGYFPKMYEDEWCYRFVMLPDSKLSERVAKEDPDVGERTP